MGWYRIDPDTGEALKEGHSKLSSPDVLLLNAVPGVDDEEDACYLGDGPWDMSSTMPAEIAAATGETLRLSDDQLRDLLLRRAVPPGVGGSSSKVGAQLLQVVDAFWKDIDSCYEDDWERPALPAERRWVCEYVVAARTNRGT